MKINLIEMEGLLHGKCLPGNMMVNESLAEYLVRQFNQLNEQLSESHSEFTAANATIHNLELKVEQVVAENVALKNPDNWLSLSDYGYEASEVADGNGASEDEALRAGMTAIINRITTPATDAQLAELRAQGVEMAIEHIEQTICPNHETILREFAAQLRQGVEHE